MNRLALYGALTVMLLSLTMCARGRQDPVPPGNEPTASPAATAASTGDATDVESNGDASDSADADNNAATAPSNQTATTLDVERILQGMTVEEKVGQLFLVWFEGPILSSDLRMAIEEMHVGGLVLFGIKGNVESPSQLARLTADAQSAARIPLLIAVDQEGGPVVRLTEEAGFTAFPSQMSLGATGSVDLVQRTAEAMAEEMRAVGINMVLAPVLDVNNNPDNPVIGLRSFGATPELVAELGSAMIAAYAAEGIVATAKHFPGHGDTDVDSHFGLPVVSHGRARLDAVELAPFRAAIAADVPAIMTAHLVLSTLDPDLPATLSPAVLTDLLRDEMGFEGVIVTDSLGMGALTARYTPAQIAERAFWAGADLLAFGADIGATVADQRAAYDHLLTLARSGAIPSQRLDDSVRRILQVKLNHGLLGNDSLVAAADVEAAAHRVRTNAHLSVAREVARQSITLVRNQAGRLPVEGEGQLLLVYPGALTSLPEALAGCRGDLVLRPVSLNPNATEIEQIRVDAALASDVVVATYNARQYPGQAALVAALADAPLITVALSSPYDLLAYPDVSTYLTTYGASPASLEALAEALCGQFEPSGQLPLSLETSP